NTTNVNCLKWPPVQPISPPDVFWQAIACAAWGIATKTNGACRERDHLSGRTHRRHHGRVVAGRSAVSAMVTIVVDKQGPADPVALAPPIPWAPIIAGGIAAVAISSVLLTFGSAVALSVVSTSSTWRDSSAYLWVVSGLFLIFAALVSF